MRSMTKKDALATINKCAKEYKQNLSNKSILFIAATNNDFVYFETTFLPQNFKHLTGVRSKFSGADFFDLAIRNRISPEDVTLAVDGSTDLKLSVLPQLMNIHITARMVGDYDQSKSLLITDKVAGTVTAAMGFIQTNGMYLPNTALKKDLREITIQATRRKIEAMFIKPRESELYRELTYMAKGMTIDDERMAPLLRGKVEVSELSAAFEIPNKHQKAATE